jgi:glyoxylase-like metal-dependent hydrolase (beta-lactamase superfamily II)
MTEDHAETARDWDRPGAHPVAPGIFRIPLPMPQDGLKAVNVYAIVSGPGVVLIDGGWAIVEAEQRLADSLALMGFGLEHVTDVLVTHAHRDHYTLAVIIRRKWGARVSIGAAERASITELTVRTEWEPPRQVAMLRRAGASELGEVMLAAETPFDNSVWAQPDRWLDDGSLITLPDQRELGVLHTPGHTAGHVVFHDREQGVLFAGDHVLPHITPSIGFEQIPPRLPLADYLTSLALLRRLPDARLLPAHGPASQHVHQRVDELLEHHAQRLEAAMKPLAHDAVTAFEVAKQLTWTRRHRPLPDLDPVNQALATLETAAHLDVLAERGHIRRQEDPDGLIRYAL